MKGKKMLTLAALATAATFATGANQVRDFPWALVGLSPAGAQAAKPKPEQSGKVVETMNTAGYTYLLVDTGAKKIWAAAPQFDVKVGDQVVVPNGVPMRNHHSKTLDRTFDVVYFVSRVTVKGAKQKQLPPGHAGGWHPATGKKGKQAKVDLSGIEKAKGGKTVAEILESKAKLAGKEVLVRGKVVKFTPRILGKNWFHLQDGTGTPGSNDLIVNTSAVAKVGDVVLVRGTVVLDVALAFGMKRDLVVENAEVTVE